MQLARIGYMALGFLIPATAILYNDGNAGKPFDEPVTGSFTEKDSVGLIKGMGMIKPLPDPEIALRLFEKGKGLFTPDWDNEGKINQMISAIYHSDEEGLDPEDYHFSEIQLLTDSIIMSGGADREKIKELESYLNDALLHLSSHVSSGKTDPAFAEPDWKVSGRGRNKSRTVTNVSLPGGSNILEMIANLEPRHQEYHNLKKALAEYRKIESRGGWRSFNTRLHKLETGMTHPDVALLRLRLEDVQGRIYHNPGEENYFDHNLKDQVEIFQRRNGLTPDGVVGKSTIEALNIPVSERIGVIRANLERWRWITDNLGDRYILVNVPDFELQVFDNGMKVFRSLAIVGRNKRETPLFSSELRFLIINPQWTVPPTILKDDIMPALRKDSAYLAANDLKMVNNRGEEINPAFIDWDNIPAGGYPFRIKQDPGSNNPLGKVKFMFPNPYDVYIHDTPSKTLFTQSTRAFSSGCIRINNALSLAEFLLKDDPAWNTGRLENSVKSDKEQVVVLHDPIPVHIVYFTAWADDKGVVTFGRDVYDRDSKLITALDGTFDKRH